MPTMESGTSGMKATLNGVPSLIVLDGWWIVGCIEGVTGWAIDGVAQAKETQKPQVCRESLFRMTSAHTGLATTTAKQTT